MSAKLLKIIDEQAGMINRLATMLEVLAEDWPFDLDRIITEAEKMASNNRKILAKEELKS